MNEAEHASSNEKYSKMVAVLTAAYAHLQQSQKFDFANPEEIEKINDEYDIGRVAKPSVGNISRRILHTYKLKFSYAQIPPQLVFVDLFQKIGHSESILVAEKIHHDLVLAQYEIDKFVRSHAGDFNQLMPSKRMEFYNRNQFIEFLADALKLMESFGKPIVSLEHSYSQIPKEIVDLQNKQMMADNIMTKKLLFQANVRIRSKETSFEKENDNTDESRDDFIKRSILQMLGFKPSNAVISNN